MVPPPLSFESRKRQAADASLNTSRPEKRSRVNGSQRSNRENTQIKDEETMMDDLMAGLDASMFDGLDSSPVRSQKLSQHASSQRRDREKPMSLSKPTNTAPSTREAVRQPLGERTDLSDRSVRASRSPLKTRPLPAFRPIKLEPNPLPVAPLDLQIPTPEHKSRTFGLEIKPVLEDEDEFAFHFDLQEFAQLDDDVLLKPHATAKVRPAALIPLQADIRLVFVSYPKPRGPKAACRLSVDTVGSRHSRRRV